MYRRKTDVVIIGSGLAALMVAERLSSLKRVILITKGKLTDSNSYLAQGGIAASVSSEDTWLSHLQDTLAAGAGHNDTKATELLVRHGPALIERLIALGVSFDRNENGTFSLGMEGAHQSRRILHAGGDRTGRMIVEQLLSNIMKKVEIYEEEFVYDVIVHDEKCIGVTTKGKNGVFSQVYANHVILATGGIGQLYSITSNWLGATGDGIAMAYRAGAKITDIEFVQFHPTLLVHNQQCYGLVSEAVRGEGASLVTEDGFSLMDGKHIMGDLAPRDIVARNIFYAKQQNKHTYLNISSISNFEQRFPAISLICQRAGLKISNGLIPISPGAHFLMGGIMTDEYGRTSIEGLYAVGECACTGVHGANRLASNSLLEAIVFAEQVALDILKQQTNDIVFPSLPKSENKELLIPLPKKTEIKQILDSYAGIVRTMEGLWNAKKWISSFEAYFYQTNLYLSPEEQEVVNMLTIANLITTAALVRTESRGGHFRQDFPMKSEAEWSGVRIVQDKSGMSILRFNVQRNYSMQGGRGEYESAFIKG